MILTRNKKSLRLGSNMLLAVAVFVAMLIEVSAFRDFLAGKVLGLLIGHVLAITVLCSAIFARRFVLRRKLETILFSGVLVWACCPIVGPLLALVVVMIARKSQSKVSDLRELLFDNAHQAEERPLRDRYTDVAKRLHALSRPTRSAVSIMDDDPSDQKIRVMNQIERIGDGVTGRVFQSALRDQSYEVQMYAATKLSSSEEFFYQEIRSLLRRISLVPDDVALRSEFMRQCLIFYNANICSPFVSRIWVLKAFESAQEAPAEAYDAQSIILFGRCAMILEKFDVAKAAFSRACRSEFEPDQITAWFYRAELAYNQLDFSELKQAISAVRQLKVAEESPITKRLRYWM